MLLLIQKLLEEGEKSHMAHDVDSQYCDLFFNTGWICTRCLLQLKGIKPTTFRMAGNIFHYNYDFSATTV